MSVSLRASPVALASLAMAVILSLVCSRIGMSAPLQTATLDDATHAVVRIRGCNVQGCNQGVGSGAFIDPSGLILTAHHVTLSDPLNPLSPQLEDFVIEITENPRKAPLATYRARVVAQKSASDLALLQIYWDDVDGHELEPTELHLPYLQLANPESVSFGEELTILGYPLAGGRSINYASEGLSGFDDDGRLLKVQKSLSEGNSGGPALVQRQDGYQIAGVVIERRGTLGEVGMIRNVSELYDLDWASDSRRAVVSNAEMALMPGAGDYTPVVRMDLRLFDLVSRSVRLLAYAYDAVSLTPYRPADPMLPTTAGGQLVLVAEVEPDSFVGRVGEQAIRLTTLPDAVQAEDLVFRLALWDATEGQLLWGDLHWRQLQEQTTGIAPMDSGAATFAPTATSIAAPVAATPDATATPTLPPTEIPTETPAPSATATATLLPTVTSTKAPPRCSVQADSLNLRSGPGSEYVPPLAVLPNRTALRPIARSGDSTWIEVQVEDSGQSGWVSANAIYVACDMTIADLPLGEIPPTPIPPTPLPATPTPTAVAPPQINVSASSGSSNNIVTFGGSGQTVYSDRGYTYSDAPAALIGMYYVQTANNDREHLEGDFWLNVDVNRPVRVYVAYSDAYGIKPGWLQSFADTGWDLRFVDALGRTVTLSVYVQHFPAGRITLGANTPAGSETHTMYTVFVTEDF